MGDDAFGPYVAKVIKSRFIFKDDVSVIEAGTAGFDLAPILSEYEIVIVIDTVRAAGLPGEIKRFTLTDLLKPSSASGINAHDPGLKEALLNLEISGGLPKSVILFGVIPDDLEVGVGLSPNIKQAVNPVIDAVLSELALLDVVSVPIEQPKAPDIWWENHTFHQ